MTINIECAKRHLKRDYIDIGKYVVVVGSVCALLIGVIYTIVNAGSIIDWVSTHAAAMPIPDAYFILNVISGVIILSFTIGVAIFGNKKTFIYKAPTSDYDSTVVDKENGSDCFIIMAYLCAAPFYLFYAIVWALSNDAWESPVTSAIIFVILILIGTPIGCTIARCKE